MIRRLVEEEEAAVDAWVGEAIGQSNVLPVKR
jgi:hypothetical protein